MIPVNANTDDGYVEFMGLQLTPLDAKAFAERLIWAANLITEKALEELSNADQ